MTRGEIEEGCYLKIVKVQFAGIHSLTFVRGVDFKLMYDIGHSSSQILLLAALTTVYVLML